MTEERPRPARADRLTSMQAEHPPLRPLWLCRTCGQPWPCGPAKLGLVAEYQDSLVSLCLYLAGYLYDAIDDLHRLNPSMTGSAAHMFDRFLGWPARSFRATGSRQTEEAEA